MKTKNILIAGLAIVVIGAAYVWFFVYNKAHTDYQSVEAVYSGDAQEFYTEAISGSFTSAFLNEAVQLSGNVSSIESSTLLILEPGIICQADSTTTFEGISNNDNITLKGRAVGTDEDLLTGDLLIRLDQCVIQ